MNWLAFVAELVKAIAWPLAVLSIVVILRKPLVTLLPLLSKFKWKDFELEFGRDVSEVKAEVAEKLPAADAARAIPSPTSELVSLINVSPRAAILEAWIQLDRAARSALARHNQLQPVQQYVPTTKIISALQSSGIVDADQAGFILALRALRNEAAHAPDFALSEQSARDYIEAAGRLINYLDAA